jgi:hypothetical protein
MASFPWNYNSNVSAEIEGQIKVIEALNKADLRTIQAKSQAELRTIQAKSNAKMSEEMQQSINDGISTSSKYWRENMSTHISHHGGTHHDICHQPGNLQSNDTW